MSGRPGHRRAGWQQINATVSGSLAGGEAVCGSENTDAICATDEHVSRGLRTRTSAGGPQISRAAGKSPAVAWSNAACVQRPRLCYWRTAPCLRVLPLADRWELQKGQQAKKRAQGTHPHPPKATAPAPPSPAASWRGSGTTACYTSRAQHRRPPAVAHRAPEALS